MTTLKCDQKGCTYVASHIKSGYAAAMLGRHKHSAHGIPAKLYKRKDGLPTQPRGPKPVLLGNSSVENQAPVESQPLASPNYCPNCGCNLRAVTVAMNLKGRR